MWVSFAETSEQLVYRILSQIYKGLYFYQRVIIFISIIKVKTHAISTQDTYFTQSLAFKFKHKETIKENMESQATL